MKRVKILLFFAVFCVSVTKTFAQDVITLKNGDDVQAIVQEIGEVDVKYKKFENPNGPNYIMKKSEIFMIMYANGSKDVFADNNAPITTTVTQTPVPSYQPNVQNQSELLYLTKSSIFGIRVKNSSGTTLLKNEIANTLTSVPEAFRLYNNGVTLKGVGSGFGIAGMAFCGIGYTKYITSPDTYYPWGWYAGSLLCVIPRVIFTNAGVSNIDSAIGVYNSVKSGSRSSSKNDVELLEINMGWRLNVVNRSGRTLPIYEVRNMLSIEREALYLYDAGLSNRRTGSTWAWIGLGCFVGGTTLAIAGAIKAENTDDYYDIEDSDYTTAYVGLGIMCGSLLCTIPWSIYWSKGAKKIDSAVDIYNSSVIKRHHKSDVSLNFGIMRTGSIGFALNF